MRMRWILVFVLLITVLLPVFGFGDDRDRKWQAFESSIDQKWASGVASMDEQWGRYEKAYDAKWSQFEKRVTQKWEDFTHSTKKVWVEYNQSFDSRSRVDFEKGCIRLETVVPESAAGASKTAVEKLREQFSTSFQAIDDTGHRILENQIRDETGQMVSQKNLRRFFDKDLAPAVKPDAQPYPSRDGIVRRKYYVDINLIPEHIFVRARRYLPVVERNASRFKLKPQFVLAIIHAESCFNPRAVSSAQAFGLMQIIPRYAGREAFQFVYGTDKLITENYLFEPANNIELGCAYLHLLRYRHFKDVPGDKKNRYISICGYNWGPGNVRKKILDLHRLSQMNDDEAYALLRRTTPAETRDYLKNVKERMPLYEPLLSSER